MGDGFIIEIKRVFTLLSNSRLFHDICEIGCRAIKLFCIEETVLVPVIFACMRKEGILVIDSMS